MFGQALLVQYISTFCGLSGFIKRIYSYWRHLTQTRPHIFHTMTFWSLFVTIIYYNLPNFCLVIRSLSARACPLTLTNKMCMMPVHTTRLNLRPSILYILLYLFSIIEWLSSCQNVFKTKLKWLRKNVYFLPPPFLAVVSVHFVIWVANHFDTSWWINLLVLSIVFQIYGFHY